MGGVNHIDNVYQQAGDYKTCYHRQHIFPIGKQHYCHGEGYFVIFYFEYAVRTSAYFNEIIVDGSQYGEATAKAEQLEERNGRPPFFFQQQADNGTCRNEQTCHDGECDECRKTDGLAISPYQPFPFVLDGTEYGEGGILYTSVNQADTHIAHFVSLRIISQLFLRKQFADDNGIDIQEAGIDEACQ